MMVSYKADGSGKLTFNGYDVGSYAQTSTILK